MIADMASCSDQTVVQLLEHDGISIRGHPRRFPERPDITRDLLYRRYIEQRWDLGALAEDLGTNRNHIIKLMRQMNIPKRKRASNISNSLAPLNLPQQPSPALPAVAHGLLGLVRLRLIVQIPGHNNFVSAAADIYNDRARALIQRINAIEKYAGFQIIDRKATPMTATEKGSAFIAEARLILDAVDAAENPAHAPVPPAPTTQMIPDGSEFRPARYAPGGPDSSASEADP